MPEPLPKTGRIPCLVIGCRRTAPASKYPPGTAIICGKCWRLAPKHMRARIRRVERIGWRIGIDWKTVSWSDVRNSPSSTLRRVLILHAEQFDKIVKAATEAKVGIG